MCPNCLPAAASAVGDDTVTTGSIATPIPLLIAGIVLTAGAALGLVWIMTKAPSDADSSKASTLNDHKPRGKRGRKNTKARVVVTTPTMNTWTSFNKLSLAPRTKGTGTIESTAYFPNQKAAIAAVVRNLEHLYQSGEYFHNMKPGDFRALVADFRRSKRLWYDGSDLTVE
ncbi:MAG: hypothetical protein HYX66_08875 [Ignavibacteria bacterium]|nr:hypothetical protein [Ignavibacteria bacterium]